MTAGERFAEIRRKMPVRTAKPISLRRQSGMPVWMSLLLRLGLALALIGVALAVNWIDRGGLKDNVDGTITFSDVVYFTMITVTTVGYGDIVPVTERARLFDAFGLTPIRLFVWLIFVGTAYQLVLQRLVEDFRMRRLQSKLEDHAVICGFDNPMASPSAWARSTGHPSCKARLIIHTPPTRFADPQ